MSKDDRDFGEARESKKAERAGTRSMKQPIYLDPTTDERLDIVHTPNGWVRPRFAERDPSTQSGDPTWAWTFDSPATQNTYQHLGFESKIAAARDCYNFAKAMCAGEIESRETRR